MTALGEQAQISAGLQTQRAQLANFKRFRRLVDRCVDLSVRIADRQTKLRRRQSAASKA